MVLRLYLSGAARGRLDATSRRAGFAQADYAWHALPVGGHAGSNQMLDHRNSQLRVRYGQCSWGARLALIACVGSVSLVAFDATRGAVRASLVEALDLSALVAESDRVLLARVISLTSHYDKRGQIVTDFTMQVEETVKGDEMPGAAIKVRRLGGVVDGIGMRVAGEPSFQVGETVLLFGELGGEDASLRPVGMAQGALRVFEKDGARWARSAGGGVAAVRRAGSGKLRSAPMAVEQPRRLDELLVEIRSLVDAPKAR